MRVPSVYAIIVTFNPDIQLLRQQYISISQQVDGIVYVDNGSSDIDSLSCYFKQLSDDCQVSILYNEKNIGLGGAQNQGINLATAKNATHILLLDHDSVVEEEFVSALLTQEAALLLQGINIGAVGPIFFNQDNGVQYPVSKISGFRVKRVYPVDVDEEVSFLIASGCLIRAEVLSVVGLMNSDLFVDTIDVEWSFRAQSKGYKLYAIPKAKMQHKIGDKRMSFMGRNISFHSPLRRYYLCRNCIHMYRFPYIPLPFKVRALVLNFLRIVAMLLNAKQRRFEYISFCFAGFKDGLCNVKGAYPRG